MTSSLSEKAQFDHADCRGATFAGSDLKIANFANCNLDGADLTRTTLDLADFHNASVNAALTTGAHGTVRQTDQVRLIREIYNPRTVATDQ